MLTASIARIDFARGRLFDTHDVDEARELCGRVFNPHRLQLLGPGQRLRARMDHLRLGSLSLNRLGWGAAVAVDPDRLGDYYLLSLPVAGHACFDLGGHRFVVSTRCAGLVNAAQRFRFEASADFEQVVLRFERSAVEAAWTALRGRPPEAAIDFDAPLPLDSAAWRALEPSLELLCTVACSDELPPATRAHLLARIEDTLLGLLLAFKLPSATAGGTAPAVAPSALVLRVQRAMRERLEDPWTLGAAARAGGVASRTLQAAFHRHCGRGPMQWLRDERLEAAHAALATASGRAVQVTGTALGLGFTHLGEFSRAYRARFGESPRETLARRD